MSNRVRRGRWGLAVLVSLSLFAVACGDEDDDTSDSGDPTTTVAGGGASTTAAPTTEPSDVDPDGVLKLSALLISSLQGVHFDPIHSLCTCTSQYTDLVFGTLLRQADDGTLQPWMAEKVEVVDPKTVRITVRPNITFTDGAKYDAEAVKAGMMRTRFESADAAIAGAQHPGTKILASVEVVDPLTGVAHLDKPLAAVFLESLAGNGGLIVSPKQVAENPAEVDTKPVGAGPYLMQKYDVDQLIEYRKNPNFWDADAWRLAGIDYVQTPGGLPRVNGLLSDTIDMATEVPVGSLDPLKADSKFEIDTSGRRYSAMWLCQKAPFDNKAVRQALNVAIDREGYNELIFNGLGEPAYGHFPSDSPYYDPALATQLAHDPAKAKKLLADAGVTNLSFDLWIVTQINMSAHAEVVQEQLKEAGITANIRPSENVYAEWIQPSNPGSLMTYLLGIGGYDKFAGELEPGGQQAFCGLNAQDVMVPAREAAALDPSDPKAVAAMKKANQAYVDGSYHIPLVFEPIPTAWNTSRIGGEPTFITLGDGNPRPRFESMYIKK